MCSLPLASSNSIVWSVSFSVSLPLTRIQFNSLRVDPHQQCRGCWKPRRVAPERSSVWTQSSTSWSLSRGVKRFSLSWRRGGLFTPHVCSAGVVQVCIRNEEDGRASVQSSLPRTRRRRAEICLYLPEWFFQSAGWRPNNLPESAESLTQKVLEPTKKNVEESLEILPQTLSWDKEVLLLIMRIIWTIKARSFCFINDVLA